MLSSASTNRGTSRYELVSFRTTPYAQIENRIRRQDRLVGAGAIGLAAIAAGVGAALHRRGGAR